MDLNLSGSAIFWEFKLSFYQFFFYALCGNMDIRHFGMWAGLKGEFIP